MTDFYVALVATLALAAVVVASAIVSGFLPI